MFKLQKTYMNRWNLSYHLQDSCNGESFFQMITCSWRQWCHQAVGTSGYSVFCSSAVGALFCLAVLELYDFREEDFCV